MRQVLINLLRNAVKFTEIGVITFKVGDRAEKTQFQVEDTGIGIAPDAKGTGIRIANSLSISSTDEWRIQSQEYPPPTKKIVALVDARQGKTILVAS